MTQLIDPTDPRYFQVSCDKPYDRHDYKIVLTSGQTIITDDYMQVMATWFENPGQFLDHVEVLDMKKKTKGFKD